MATITGTNGNDTLTGTGGADSIYPLLGSNSITAGGGDDTIYSVGGSDKINGGAGTDYWVGDYSGSATARTFTWNAATGAGTLTGGTTLTSIEQINFTGGGGADTVTLNGNAAGYYFQLATGGGNDTITVRVCGGTLDAGAGIDSLTLDFSADTDSDAFYLYNNSAGGFYGGYNAFGYGAGFYNVEKLTVRGGSGDDYFALDTAPLVSGATVAIDGGAGTDTLSVDFTAFTNTSFVVGTGGAITANRGSFANLEAFNITLGGGANTVTTGAGDDSIYSVGGNDAINGGAGTDYWSGDYGSAATALNVTWNAATGAGTLSNGGTLTGIEQVTLTTGTGNDTVTINGNIADNYEQISTGGGNDAITIRTSSTIVYAGDGSDSFTLDLVADTTGEDFYIYNNGHGGFYGGYDAFGGYGSSFYDVEKMTVRGGSGDDYVGLETAPLLSGATISIDGGAGTDTLSVDFTAFTDTSFVVGTGGAITANHGSFANLEIFSVTLGGGANTVTTGGGDDSILSAGGSDAINGGSGNDYWSGDYSGSSTALSLSWNAATGVGTLSNGGTLTGIEQINFTAGAGNDTVTIDGGYSDSYKPIFTGDGNDSITLRSVGVYLVAGNGTDSLTIDVSADTTGDTVYFDNNGSGGFSGYFYAFGGYSTSIFDIEKLTVRGGSGADLFTGASGADTFIGNGGNDTLIGNAGNDSLDGGGGIDSLTGGLGNDTYVVGAVADVTKEVAGEGTDTIRSSITLSLSATERANIENLTLIGTAAINATGSAVNNTLTGNAAGNVLSGLGGVDKLIGGGGADTLDGGAGADKFVYNAVSDSTTAAADTILAFDGLGATAGDQIDLAKIDANTGVTGDQAFSFIGTAAFAGVAGQLHVLAAGADSLVQGDIDGDGVADFAILVKTAAAASWLAGDFIL